MKFRTEVHIPESDIKLNIEDKVFSIGSCFASEMSDLLAKGQIQTLNNPYGTIFNPYSINVAIQRLHDAEDYVHDELISFNDSFISLDHHSSFNSDYIHHTLEKINTNLQIGNDFLQGSNWVIITYGTSFIYEFLPKNKFAANCHKIPQKFFNKRLLSYEEILSSIRSTISNVRDICSEDVQILFTVSPVRHTKDGMMENQRSKARLLTALHDAIEGQEDCHYLPIYELMMDDLRDYRFFKEDMVHPTTQAVHYIFEKFGVSYFSDEMRTFIAENYKINQALQHRPLDDKSPKHIAFLEQLNLKIEEQQKKVKHKIFTT